jgi:hypothetical protein
VLGAAAVAVEGAAAAAAADPLAGWLLPAVMAPVSLQVTHVHTTSKATRCKRHSEATCTQVKRDGSCLPQL